MQQDTEKSLRLQLTSLLEGSQAHVTFHEAFSGIPFLEWGKKHPEAPYTLWGLLEHMRIAQWDILEFSRRPDHQSPPFPQGYWPEETAPPSAAALEKTLEAFQSDLEQMIQLAQDLSRDLFRPFPHGSGQTLLREILLVADHNAYHLGQVVFLRRLLGIWKEG